MFLLLSPLLLCNRGHLVSCTRWERIGASLADLELGLLTVGGASQGAKVERGRRGFDLLYYSYSRMPLKTEIPLFVKGWGGAGMEGVRRGYYIIGGELVFSLVVFRIKAL